MTKFSVDMAEATRLTRAGRLAEAVALLRGETPARAAPATADGAQPGAVLDMVPPVAGGDGAWSAAPEHSGTRPGPAPARPRAQRGMPLPGLRAKGRARPAIPDGAQFGDQVFQGPDGSRRYRLYVPAGHGGRALPLLVMLHGCTQTADDFALGTGMNLLAEELGFLVAYPQQDKSANANACWNWFASQDQGRDHGEPALIAGIVRQVLRDHPVDPAQVHVAGLSAGGAMAAIVAAAYPDLFGAAGVHSGLAVGAARDMGSAFAAMRGGAQALRPGARAVPTIVFHGDRDHTVAPVNGSQVIMQASAGEALQPHVETLACGGGRDCTRTVYRDAAGGVRHEAWTVHGAGHAWSGGDHRGSHTDPRGPDASREMVRFLLAHPRTLQRA